MRYEEFRLAWDDALRESKLGIIGLHANETQELRTTTRCYEVHIEPLGGQDAEPFFVAATLSWTWDALLTARAVTKEEDMLAELFGRDTPWLVTEAPSLIVNLKLNASTPRYKPLPMPSKHAWANWVRETMGRLERIESLISDDDVRINSAGMIEILAWLAPPRAKVTCNPDGEFMLESVSISAGQRIELPRTLDVGAEEDEGPEEQLRELFHRVRASLHAWMEALDHLRRA